MLTLHRDRILEDLESQHRNFVTNFETFHDSIVAHFPEFESQNSLRKFEDEFYDAKNYFEFSVATQRALLLLKDMEYESNDEFPQHFVISKLKL